MATPYTGAVHVKQVGGGVPSSARPPWSSASADPFALVQPSAQAPAWAPHGSALAPFGGYGWEGGLPLAPFGGGGGDMLGLAAADPQLRALACQVQQQMADVQRRMYSRSPPQMAIDIKGASRLRGRRAGGRAGEKRGRERCGGSGGRRPCPPLLLVPLTFCRALFPPPLPPPHARRAARAESDTDYELTANLPGVKKENISIETSRAETGDAQLCITATRVARERSDEPETWHRRERVDSTVRRTLNLPANVDLAGVASRYEHGVLHITMRKVPSAQVVSAARAIPIA